MAPEDRKFEGLILMHSVKWNITLPYLNQLQRVGFIQRSKEATTTQKFVSELGIHTPSLDQELQYLSGGNQQKVVLAKWLNANPKVIILDEPTRGIDIGAKVELWALIRNLAQRGAGIIMISSELPEVMGMSDRILTMCNGRITGEFMADQATEKLLLLAMAGLNESETQQTQTTQPDAREIQ